MKRSHLSRFAVLSTLTLLAALFPQRAPAAPVDATGTLEVVIMDDFDNHRAETKYTLHDQHTGRHFNLKFDDKAPHGLRSGDKVKVHGNQQDNDLTVAAESGSFQLVAAAAAASGQQDTIVILVSFTNAANGCTAASVSNLVFGSTGSTVTGDYLESSYGAMWFSGLVVGPYVVNYSSDSCDYSGIMAAANAAATAAGYDLNLYPRRVYPGSWGCGWGGLGTVGGNPSWSLIAYCGDGTVYAHELGHNVGMSHASTDPNNDGTLDSEYGDNSDWMGAPYAWRQLNAAHKAQMGWWPLSSILTVTNSGSFVVAPTEFDPSVAPYPLTIKIANVTPPYYISYRYPAGYDSTLPSPWANLLNIHRWSSGNTKFITSLTDGGTYTASDAGCLIKATSHTANSFSFNVTFCVARPDSVSMTIDQIAARTPVLINVLANDTSDAGCGPLTLTAFDATTAKGGSVAFSSGQLIYTPPANAFVGNDSFNYTDTDALGQVTTAAVTINVTYPGEEFYWTLDEGTGAVARDSSAASKHATVESATWTNGFYGNALAFNGTSSDVAIPALNLYTNTVTITCRVKRNGTQLSYAGLVFNRAGSTISGLDFGTANELRYHWNGTSSTYNWNSGLIPPDGQWTFCALVVEATKATMYMDAGSGLQSAVNNVANAIQGFEGTTYLGLDATSRSRSFNGSLDDVRIFPRALSAAEIANIDAGQGPASNPNPAHGSTILAGNTALNWTGAAAATAQEVYFGNSYAAVRDASLASPEFKGSQATTTFNAGNLTAGTYSWRIDELAGAVVTPGPIWFFQVNANNPLAWWKLDELTGTIAADSAGANTGAYVNAPTLGQSGAATNTGTSVTLNGTSQAVTIGNPTALQITGQITVAAWIRPTSTTGLQDIVAKGYSTSPNGEIYLRINAGNYQFGSWNGSDYSTSVAMPAGDLNNWVHLAGVYDGTAWRIYRNGVQLSATASATGAQTVNAGWAIGARGTGTERFFNGRVDDVRLYNRGLSAREVQDLYNQATTPPSTAALAITCPGNVNAIANSGCTATGITLGTATTTGGCTGVNISNNAPSTFPVGTTFVTWTATDSCSNTATCQQTVTVTDTTPPTITAPANVVVSANSGCTATGVSLGTPVTADNCTVASVVNNAPASFPKGITTVTWTVRDNSGNTATATQTVTVNDTTPPTITCPASVTTNTTTGVNLGTPVVADNCTVASVTNNAPSTFPAGTTTVTWTVRDTAGNTAQCSQTVTITTADTQAPTAPTNLRSTSQTRTSIALAWNASTDNVAVTQYLIYRAGVQVGTSTGTTFTNTGLKRNTSYSYTVKARDAAGNLSAASNTLIVKTSR